MVLFNDENIVGGTFPNGEKYYRAIDVATVNYFELIFESNEDIFNLLLYKKYIDDNFPYNSTPELSIPFLPYCQSDREIKADDCIHIFSFKYFAQLINSANFKAVYCCDPHSRVAAAAIDRLMIKYFYPMEIVHKNYDLLCYPDMGAYGKYREIFNNPCVYGNKKRDLTTGKILSYEILADKADIEGKRILIYDDLIMGGRSFKECAKALRALGAASVDLYVTHIMPIAEDFCKTYKEFGIENFYSANTLKQPFFVPPKDQIRKF